MYIYIYIYIRYYIYNRICFIFKLYYFKMETTDAHTEVDASSLTIDTNLSTTVRPTVRAIPQSSSLIEFQKRFPNVDLDLFSRYPLRRGRVGYCVIVNEKYFDPSTGQNTRDGTDRDAESLSSTFTKLGFVVDRNDNVTLAQLNNIVKKCMSC